MGSGGDPCLPSEIPETAVSRKWIGYDEDLNWYRARDFKNSPVKVQIFHATNPEAPGPPLRLLEWLRAAEDE